MEQSLVHMHAEPMQDYLQDLTTASRDCFTVKQLADTIYPYPTFPKEREKGIFEVYEDDIINPCIIQPASPHLF